MKNIEEVRKKKADALIAAARKVNDTAELTRDRLEEIASFLRELAAETAFWTAEHYPPPAEDELQNRYLIANEHDTGISLYLNVVRSGKRVPPHNHTTWACIAAVEGVEHNMFYTRTDDGSVDGKADIRLDRTVAVGPGDVIAMLPEDIHNFEVRGNQVIRHLHFYGRPLETLSERLSFDLENGTCKTMDVGAKTIT